MEPHYIEPIHNKASKWHPVKGLLQNSKLCEIIYEDHSGLWCLVKGNTGVAVAQQVRQGTNNFRNH